MRALKDARASSSQSHTHAEFDVEREVLSQFMDALDSVLVGSATALVTFICVLVLCCLLGSEVLL
jgi:hypothetical protein